MAAELNNITIETSGTEVEAAKGLLAALSMEIEEKEGFDGDGTQRALGDRELLTQDAEPSRKTLIEAHNGFNELIRLAILWTVRHRWPTGAC